MIAILDRRFVELLSSTAPSSGENLHMPGNLAGPAHMEMGQMPRCQRQPLATMQTTVPLIIYAFTVQKLVA